MTSKSPLRLSSSSGNNNSNGQPSPLPRSTISKPPSNPLNLIPPPPKLGFRSVSNTSNSMDEGSKVEYPESPNLPPTSLNKNLKKNTPEARIKRGECPKCGQKTHSINWRKKKSPLTIDGLVYNGVCLHCNFLEGYLKQNEKGIGMLMDDYYPNVMQQSNSSQQVLLSQKSLMNTTGNSQQQPQQNTNEESIPPIEELEVSDDMTNVVSVVTNDPDLVSVDGGMATVTSEKSSGIYRMASASQHGGMMMLGSVAEDKNENTSSSEKGGSGDDASLGYVPRGMSKAAARKLLEQHSVSSLYGPHSRASPDFRRGGNGGTAEDSLMASVGSPRGEDDDIDLIDQPLSLNDAMKRGMFMAEEAENSLAPLPMPPQAPPHATQSAHQPPLVPSPFYPSYQQQMDYYMFQQHQEAMRRQQFEQMYQWNMQQNHNMNPPNPTSAFQNGELDEDLDSLDYSKSSYGSGSHHLVKPKPSLFPPLQHGNLHPYYNMPHPPQPPHPHQMHANNPYQRVGGPRVKLHPPAIPVHAPNTIQEEEYLMQAAKDSPSSARSGGTSEPDHDTHDFRAEFSNVAHNDSIVLQRKKLNKSQPNLQSNYQKKDNNRNVRFQKQESSNIDDDIISEDNQNGDGPPSTGSGTVSSESLLGKGILEKQQQQQDEKKTDSNEASFRQSQGSFSLPSYDDTFDISTFGDDSYLPKKGTDGIEDASEEFSSYEPHNFYPSIPIDESKKETASNKVNGQVSVAASSSSAVSERKSYYFNQWKDEEFKEMEKEVSPIFSKDISANNRREKLTGLISKYKNEERTLSLIITLLQQNISIPSGSKEVFSQLFPALIQSLVELMWEITASSKIQASCCFLIWTLSSSLKHNGQQEQKDTDSASLIELMRHAGIIEAVLVCAMEMHRNNATVQLYACGALTSLALQDIFIKNKEVTVVSVGGMVSILSAMETHPKSALVQEFSIRALYAMCKSVNTAEAFGNNKFSYKSYNLDFVSEKGGIQMLQKAMETHVDHASLMEWSYNLIFILLCDESLGEFMLVNGILENIWKSMKYFSLIELPTAKTYRRVELSGIFVLACSALRRLFSLHQFAKLETKVLQDVVIYFLQLIHAETQNDYEMILEGTITTLSCMVEQMLNCKESSSSSSNTISANSLFSSTFPNHLFPSIVDTIFNHAINNYPSNETIQEHSFKVIQGILISGETVKSWIKDKIPSFDVHIPILLRSLQEQFMNVPILKPIIGIISSLCKEQELHIALLSCGVIFPLVHTMEAHLKIVEIQNLAIIAINNLSIHHDHIEKLIEAGVINALIQSIGNHINNKSIQEIGCNALLNLSCSMVDNHDQNAAIIIQAGGVKVVINSMQENSDSLYIQVLGCAILWNLSYSSALGNDTHPLSLNSSSDFSTAHISASSLDHSVSEIANPVINDDQKNRVAYNGGIDSIMFAILNFSDELQLLDNAIGALASLFISRDAARLFISSGYLDVLLQVLRRISSQTSDKDYMTSCKISILQSTFLALRNLASSSVSSSPFLTPGSTASVVEIIVDAMRSFPDSEGYFLQREACGALYAISVLSEENKTIVVSSGGVDAMMKALNENNGGYLDVKETKIALVHLMTW